MNETEHKHKKSGPSQLIYDLTRMTIQFVYKARFNWVAVFFNKSNQYLTTIFCTYFFSLSNFTCRVYIGKILDSKILHPNFATIFDKSYLCLTQKPYITTAQPAPTSNIILICCCRASYAQCQGFHFLEK